MPRPDDFAESVKQTLGRRVGFRCSNPNCDAPTLGPHTNDDRHVNLGVTSHISAASRGGARYDKDQTRLERASIRNAIWLCQSCAKLVDNDADRFPRTLLLHWKQTAEARALEVLQGTLAPDYFPQPPAALHAPVPRMEGSPYDTARGKLIHAGWAPEIRHQTFGDNDIIPFGNGRYFWEKGFHEILAASSTGLAHCAFGFRDLYRNRLIVVAAGSASEDVEQGPRVCNWYFASTQNEG